MPSNEPKDIKMMRKQETRCNLGWGRRKRRAEGTGQMFPCQTEEDHLVQGHHCVSLGKPWAGMMKLWEAVQLQGQHKAHPSQEMAEETSIQD